MSARKHKTTDPACVNYRPPRGPATQYIHDYNRGISCPICLPGSGGRREDAVVSTKTFAGYELRALGRTPDSFAYRIEEVWAGVIVDTAYTDERSEVERIVPLSLGQGYDVRVTSNGVTIEAIAP